MSQLKITINSLHCDVGEGVSTSTVFKDFSATFTLSSNSISVLQGRNGIGKSVLAQLVSGGIRPKAGKISFHAGESELANARIVYVPQNIESPHDRYTIDLICSVASTRTVFFNWRAFRRQLIALGLDPRALRQSCDTTPRITLLRGVLAAADFGGVDAIVLDEPFAQLSKSEQQELDAHLHSRVSQGVPTLIVAHPDQTPQSASSGLLLEADKDAKQLTSIPIRPRTERGTTPRETTGQLIANLEIHDRENKFTLPICKEVLNRLAPPPSISVGRFGGLLTKALWTGKEISHKHIRLSANFLYERPAKGRGTVGLLPAHAQTAVVLSSASLADSSLFNRWEIAPTLRFGLRIDRDALEANWFTEAAAFLPIEHENSSRLGNTLSGGNRQLLALRTVAYPFPSVLVVVSPFAGLDDKNADRAEKFLSYAAASGVIVIIIQSVE